MSTVRTGLLAAASALALAFTAAAPARAGGFYVQEQSAKGLGRAYSGEASDTGPASLWWNPAAIGSMTGIEVFSGANAISVSAAVADQGSTIRRPLLGGAAAPVGGEPRAYDPVIFSVVPNGAAGWRVNDHLAVGLVVNAPFDFITKYSPQSWTRYDAIKSRLLDIDIQPTVAWHVNEKLDLGVGLDISYADATLTNALPNLAPTLPDGSSALRGSGWDLGYVAGAQFHATPRLTFAASYRSAIDHGLDGRVNISALAGTPVATTVDAAGHATFSTPWIATVGARWGVTDRLTLDAQVQRFGWSEFDAIRVAFAGQTQVTPQNYQDTTNVAVGAEYRIHPRITLRTGVQYDPTPTPDSNRTTRVPDGDRELFAAGASVQATSRLTLDGSIEYIRFEDSRINTTTTALAGTAAATPITLQGNVIGSGWVLGGGAHYRF